MRLTRSIGLLSIITATGLACDKGKDSDTKDPEPAATSPVADKPAVKPDVPQEPDPAEIGAAAHQYLLGNYDATISALTPVYADLKERKQYRASGLAAGWLALAHAQIVVEQAEEPSKHALAMAERTQDPEVVAIAKTAHGAFLMGTEEFTAAATSLDAAAHAAPKSVTGAIAYILRGEALIGSAFGSSESTDIVRPQDLETAKQSYASAAQIGKGGVETDIILGRSEEGLAAIEKYLRKVKKGTTEALCAHALNSITHYNAAGAAPFLVDGPSRLAADAKCKPKT